MIKILLVGYGKMGKMVAENAGFIGGKIVAISDPAEQEIISNDSPNVAIEFTHPDSAYDNVRNLLTLGIPVVSGTTGWFHRIAELQAEFCPEQHTLVYGANFSVGMNLFYQIVENAAALIKQTGLYDVYGIEAHHRHKADMPSGTAKVIAEIVNSVGSQDAISASESLFTSIRAGSIVGMHKLGFDSDFDEINLVHNAKSRKGFAIGALLAAKFAIQHKGFYDFRDIFTKCL